MDRAQLDDMMREKVLFSWNANTADYRRDRCLHQLFEDQVVQFPQQQAVRCGSDQLSYEQLNARANQLARALHKQGARPGQRIALCLRRSIEMVIAILGVMKAGCAYVPIASAYPKDRISFMLSDAEPALLITQESLVGSLPTVQSPTLCLERLLPNLKEEPTDNLNLPLRAEDTAYVIYTSGSTGTPKGVEVPHRGTYNTTLAHIDLCKIHPSDQLLQFAAFGFDTSILEILMAIGAGATLVLVPQDELLLGESLAQLIREQNITVATLQPSVLASLPDTPLPSLRVLLSAGEACTPQIVSRFAPGRELWNAYGPTEGSVCVTLARLTDQDAKHAIVPIGRPLPNTRVYILDENLQPVALGEQGELCIGGIAVASGYLNRPELTQQKFLPDPFLRQPDARIYRTGDLARFRPDGQIEFLGRIDHQIKLRGFRIELGEIEATLVSHPAVAQAAVIVREDTPGDKRLCGYLVLHPGQALTLTELRTFVSTRLPSFMVPAAIVILESLPLTSHGKLDRARLPQPGTARPLATVCVPPENERETQLARLFAAVLRLDEVSVLDDFFELGGDSLLAAKLVAQIHKELGARVPIAVLFAHRTVRSLAGHIDASTEAQGHGLTLADRSQPLPLSSSQEQIWLTSQLHATTPLYNEPYELTLRGPIHIEHVTTALHQLIARHEILRTTFAIHNGVPCQQVHAPFLLPLPVVDLSRLPMSEQPTALRRIHDELAQQLFDLQKLPLLRATLCRLSDEETRLLLVFHHAIFDGMSLANVFLPELADLYFRAERSAQALPAPPAQYADFAVWEQRLLDPQTQSPHLDFWRKQLADLPVLQLPTDAVRPKQAGFRGARHPVHIDARTTERLSALAKAQGATLYTTLVSGLAALLHRYTGQSDLPIAGVVSAQQQHPELAGLIGPFVNTLVLRIDLTQSPSMQELIGRVRDTLLASLSHSSIPFQKLVETLRPERSLGQQPLFQVMCLLDPPTAELPPNWSVTRFTAHNGTAMCDLSLQLERRSDGLYGFFEYNTDILTEATMARWTRHLLVLIGALLDKPELPIARLPILPDDERALIDSFGNPSISPPSSACLHQLFSDQARRSPSAVAVVCENESLTYAALDRASSRVAAQLAAHHVKPNQPIGLCAERSLELVVGIIGILKAGGAYLPLDPVYPSERIRFLLDDAQVQVVVAQDKVRKVLPSSPDRVIITLSTNDGEEPAAAEPSCPLPDSSPDQLAYIIYTSGSTGNPKGVKVSHRNVARLFSATDHWFSFSSSDVFCLFHSFAFDFSVWELWGALLYGGRLVIVPYWVSRSPESFYRLLSDEKVTVLNQTPSAFYQLIAVEQMVPDLANSPLSVRFVVFGGEALDLAALRPFIDRHGEDSPVLVNMYGITETTVHVTYHKIRRADCDRPGSVIGVPIPDLRLRVLDRQLQPVPIGIPGELLVGGGGVAQGYLNRPQLTAERFIDDPIGQTGEKLYRSGDWVRYRPDGTLEYLGRIDHQIKIRGFRIELGEIEEALTQHPDVRAALVIASEARQGDKRIVAYVVAKGDPNDATLPARIRSFVEGKLPSYMVPAHLVVLSQFPLTANGKVDRRALPAPEAEKSVRSQYAAPQTFIEEQLAAIFAEILGVDRVGVHDGFFELGGHSLLVTRAIFSIREVFHVELPMRALFESPTVAGLSRHLESLRPGRGGLKIPNIVAEARSGPLPLSFAQQRLWFLGQLLPDAPSYNEPVTVRFKESVHADALSRALNEIVARHEVWRTTFHVTDGEPVQIIHPPSLLPLPIEDYRTLAEEEREAAFMKRCTEEAHRPFDLTTGPLVRFVLLILSDEDARLFLTFHHIVADGLSIYSVFNVELAKLYRAFCGGAPSPLPVLPIQYADFTLWQRRWLSSELVEKQLAYWTHKLAGLPKLELPQDHTPPPKPTFRGGRQLLSLPKDATERLRRLGHSEGATLFITLLTALKTLFYRYIEQQEIVIGIVTAGRQRPELAPLLGFFPNTLVLRTEMDGALSFRGLLRRVREVTLGAFDNQDVPFERVVEAVNPVRLPGETPLFRVGFILDPKAADLGVDWAMTSLDVELDAAKFDLSLELVEVTNGLVGRIGYRSELFEAATIERMAGHYLTLLASIVDSPDLPVRLLPILTPTEQRALLTMSRPVAAFPDGKCVHELFEQQVDYTPDAIAVSYQGHSLSYRALDEAANQLAHTLQDIGVAAGEIVGICVERSPRLVISMLGILKAGAAFLILDPAYPKDRLALLCKDADLGIILSESAQLSRLPAPRRQTLLLDEVSQEKAPRHRPEHRTTERSLAYVIYTSGSTGQPKGVLIEHRGLCSVISAQSERLGLRPGSRVLQFASLSFDATIWELFLALLHGGTAVLATREQLLPGPGLIELLSRERIDTLTITPSVLSVVPLDPLPDLQVLILAGEPLPKSLCDKWRAPYRRIFNAYGPTEATICATIGEVSATDDPPTIGTPVPNTAVLILDRSLQPVPIGVAGEICLGGVAVAREYLGRPELTGERFVASPFAESEKGESARLYRTGDLGRYRPDGRVEYLGRIDQQVKVRGFRIEPGEVEAALRSFPGIDDAAVVVRKQPDGQNELLAYYVPSGGTKTESGSALELWPSVAEHLVHDELISRSMTHDERRNQSYLRALQKYAPGHTVVDIGTGPEAILARLAIEAGARKVYALERQEDSYRKACATVQALGLSDRISVIHGDVTTITLPEAVDVGVSALIGAIGGSAAAAHLMSDARRLLMPVGKMIPERSLTQLAAVTVPESLMQRPMFGEQARLSVQKIFDQVGHRYDLRLCLRGLTRRDLISNVDVLEDLDFQQQILQETTHSIRLVMDRDATLHGLLAWLRLFTAGEEVIDILDHEHCWLPVFLPAFGMGIEVRKGTVVTAQVERTLCPNGRNPDFSLRGMIEHADGRQVPFAYVSSHVGPGYRSTPFYDHLFANDQIPTEPPRIRSAGLRAHLERLLPDFMIPSGLFPIDELPRTPNGKIDRAALAARTVVRQSSTSDFVAPQTDLQQTLSAIWRDVLQVERVGLHDNFFDLGGHSLKMAQVHTRLREALGKEISLLTLFQYPTIGTLTAFLSGDAQAEQKDTARSQERGRLRKEAAALLRQRAQERKKRDE